MPGWFFLWFQKGDNLSNFLLAFEYTQPLSKRWSSITGKNSLLRNKFFCIRVDIHQKREAETFLTVSPSLKKYPFFREVYHKILTSPESYVHLLWYLRQHKDSIFGLNNILFCPWCPFSRSSHCFQLLLHHHITEIVHGINVGSTVNKTGVRGLIKGDWNKKKLYILSLNGIIISSYTTSSLYTNI